MFELILFIIIVVSVTCMLAHRGFMLSVLTFVLVALLVGAIIVFWVSGALALLMIVSGDISTLFTIWCISALVWCVSSHSLDYVNKYCDKRAEFDAMQGMVMLVPSIEHSDISKELVDEFINKK